MVIPKRFAPADLLIILLIVLALILGFLIYKQKNPAVSNENSNVESTPERNSNQQSSESLRPTLTGLSSDEHAVFNPPGPNASQEEKSQHFNTIVKLAKKTDVLDLNSCSKPNPLVFEAKLNEKIKIKNSDTKDHTVRIDNDHKYVIKKGSTAEISASFGKGQGAYGYLCDNVGGVVGFFLVKP